MEVVQAMNKTFRPSVQYLPLLPPSHDSTLLSVLTLTQVHTNAESFIFGDVLSKKSNPQLC